MKREAGPVKHPRWGANLGLKWVASPSRTGDPGHKGCLEDPKMGGF